MKHVTDSLLKTLTILSMMLLTSKIGFAQWTTGSDTTSTTNNVKAPSFTANRCKIKDTIIVPLIQTHKIALYPGDSLLHFGDSSIVMNPVSYNIYSMTQACNFCAPIYWGIAIGAHNSVLGSSYTSTSSIAIGAGNHISNGIGIGNNNTISGSGYIVLGSGITNSISGAILMGNTTTNKPAISIIPDGTGTTAGNVGIGTTSPAYSLDVNGTINAQASSALWTTSTGSPYAPATSNTNGGWEIPMIIPNGGAIRTASTGSSGGHYLGFGMVDEATTGWYWMAEGTSGNTATACYPMTLLMDINGSATLTVSQNGWCDYVFNNGYTPMSIVEKENYYKTYKHLPGIDPDNIVRTKGLNINKNMEGMLKNIEEDRLDITKLYDIIKQQQKEIEELKNKLNSIQVQK